jgi:protein-L-isoaspartate(D-aspartate) O-methyltransferase
MLNKRKEMVKKLSENGYIKTEKVRRAMSTVPREEFIPNEKKVFAYVDKPLPLMEGQTISAPHMVAIICEELELEEGMRVLEIGTGFGYNAAVISELMNKKGQVYSIERLKSLFNIATQNLKRTGYHENIELILGDGTLGYEKRGPYDRIYGTATAPHVPAPLKEQLKVGGKLLIPVGEISSVQSLISIEKVSKSEFMETSLGGVAFVPMIGKYGWEE